MTFNDWKCINSHTETETLSSDNHIFHYVEKHYVDWSDELEIDEDLETMQISIRFLGRKMHIKGVGNGKV